jgi:hypothetical protein
MEKNKAGGQAPSPAAKESPHQSNLPVKHLHPDPGFQPIVKEKAISVDETIRRVLAISDHIRTRKILFNHLDRLEALKFGEYDEKDSLTLTNAKGDSYTIRSTPLCMKLTEVAKREISSKIAEIEDEIQAMMAN